MAREIQRTRRTQGIGPGESIARFGTPIAGGLQR
jgi:hypothetical protein